MWSHTLLSLGTDRTFLEVSVKWNVWEPFRCLLCFLESAEVYMPKPLVPEETGLISVEVRYDIFVRVRSDVGPRDRLRRVCAVRGLIRGIRCRRACLTVLTDVGDWRELGELFM